MNQIASAAPPVAIGLRAAARRTFRSALAFALVCGLAAFVPQAAWAEEAVDDPEAAAAKKAVEDARGALESAESLEQGVAADHEALVKEVAELQQRIDETAAEALEAQKALVEGRSHLSRTAAYEYRSGSSRSVMALIMESRDFDHLVRNLAYLSAISRHQSDEIAAQKERAERFDALVAELNARKDEQDAKLAELEAQRVEAKQLVSAASTKLQGAQDEYASKLEELKRKAEEDASNGVLSGPVAVEDSNTVTSRPGDQISQIEPDPAPSPAPEAGAGDGSAPEVVPDPGAGWSSGVASAYGGSTDPYTPNPGVTATGAVCDDWSMGVAVPMAWPRYWQYYGRTVEISYNGMTVLATVNDCGYMGGGSRSLDLQPGVWKAFGFSSCTDWGLRTVSYRFL